MKTKKSDLAIHIANQVKILQSKEVNPSFAKRKKLAKANYHLAKALKALESLPLPAPGIDTIETGVTQNK